MKITWNQNPMATTIELDEHEKREMWHKIRFEQMLDLLFTVHYELTYKKEAPDMERIKKEVDPDYYLNEKDDAKTPLDMRCDNLLEHYLEELQMSHCGDCTCFAMSCSKCHAEGMLGIDTIKGLGKHPGHKIQAAFEKVRTCDEAIELLESNPGTLSPGYESYWERWAGERVNAIAWLKQYRDDHFSPHN